MGRFSAVVEEAWDLEPKQVFLMDYHLYGSLICSLRLHYPVACIRREDVHDAEKVLEGCEALCDVDAVYPKEYLENHRRKRVCAIHHL